eukprot:scaffold5455_cov145-Skeletonema_menzelii.AAC.6
MKQPHGRGTLVYENGLVLDCNWCNGRPSKGIDDSTAAALTSPKKQSNQIHPDYDLGMSARSRHDMKEEDADKALKGISRLKKFDFAFVRRSNEQWTYSIICDRTDDTITFVVDEVGRRKTIPSFGWLKNIRRIQVIQVQKYHDRACGQKKSHSRSRHPRRRRRSSSVPPREKGCGSESKLYFC